MTILKSMALVLELRSLILKQYCHYKGIPVLAFFQVSLSQDALRVEADLLVKVDASCVACEHFKLDALHHAGAPTPFYRILHHSPANPTVAPVLTQADPQASNMSLGLPLAAGAVQQPDYLPVG